MTILTDMLAQGRILNAYPDKVNTVEATVSLIHDGTSVFSAVMSGSGVTLLNSRTGAGSPFGGITALSLSPFSTPVVEYSFFAQVIVNGPVMSPVPLPASGHSLPCGASKRARVRRVSRPSEPAVISNSCARRWNFIRSPHLHWVCAGLPLPLTAFPPIRAPAGG